MKYRSKNQCKKENCKRYKNYINWSCGDPNLNYCMNCKHAHVSQYERLK